MLIKFIQLLKSFLTFDSHCLKRGENYNKATTCCSTNWPNISGRRKLMMPDRTTIKLPMTRTPNTSNTWVYSDTTLTNKERNVNLFISAAINLKMKIIVGLLFKNFLVPESCCVKSAMLTVY